MLRQSKAIVLNRQKVQDADDLTWNLLEDGTQRRLRLHGIRGSRNRSQLLSEPGCEIAIVFYDRDDQTSSLKEGRVIQRFESSKSTYHGLLCVSYVLEAARIAIGQGEAPAMYPLVRGTLHTLDENLDETSLLLAFYRIRLFKLMGVLGDVDHCSECGSRLSDRPGAFWHVPELYFACDLCHGGASPEDLRAAGLFAEMAVTRFKNLLCPDDRAFVEWIDRRLHEVLESYNGRPLKSGLSLYRKDA